MAFISLGKIDKNMIPIIVGCIFVILFEILFLIVDNTLSQHLVIIYLYAVISKLLIFIPFVILKIRSKKVNGKPEIKDDFNVIEYIYIDNRKEINKNKYLYILLSSTLHFVSGIIQIQTFGMKVNSWIWDIIFYSLFYYLIFKTKIYNHHYLCIIIIIIVGFILDISLENFQEDFKNNWYKVLLRMLREILYSFQGVINKYIMDKKYCSVYELLSFTGLFSLIFLGIYILLDYFFIHLDNLKEYFNNFDYRDLLTCVGLIIAAAGLDLSSLFTIKKNTPCHLFIIGEFMTVFENLFYLTEQLNTTNLIIMIICYIIIFFFSLVFNEIIEINCFGLSANTRKNIMKRAKIENLANIKCELFDYISEENRSSSLRMEMNDDDNSLIK